MARLAVPRPILIAIHISYPAPSFRYITHGKTWICPSGQENQAKIFPNKSVPWISWFNSEHHQQCPGLQVQGLLQPTPSGQRLLQVVAAWGAWVIPGQPPAEIHQRSRCKNRPLANINGDVYPCPTVYLTNVYP